MQTFIRYSACFLMNSVHYIMLLENNRNDYVLFQAACAIKDAIVREWTLLRPADIVSLRNFLLQYVTQNSGSVNSPLGEFDYYF